MQTLDESIFDEVGLTNLSADEKKRMLGYVVQALQNLVGLRLMAAATSDQLETFNELTEAGDDSAIVSWLEKTFPNFDEIIDEELKSIKQSLTEGGQDILKAEA